MVSWQNMLTLPSTYLIPAFNAQGIEQLLFTYILLQ